MEKFGVAQNDLIDGLRMEEHELMMEINKFMCSGEKSSSEYRELSQLEGRLNNVRNKITETDLKKPRTN